MEKVFEDYFTEIQADMVSICLEYVNDRADQIYIHCSHEKGIISSCFFYCINGKIVKKHKLNDALIGNEDFQYDVSGDRQGSVLRILNEDIERIMVACEKNAREMPTEMKLVYDVKKNSLKADYSYELQYANDPVKTADDIADAWFQQVKAENS